MYEYRKLTSEQRADLVRQRLARGFPPHSPPHPITNQNLYLLTATNYEHTKVMFTDQRRKELLDLVFDHMISNGIEIRAWVVLPNHYHLLVHLNDFKILGQIFKQIHGSTARQWNIEDKQAGRKVWYRFTDRAIRSERHYYTTLNYIHFNPVKHRCAKSPYDWTTASVHWYLEYLGRDWLRDIWMRCPIKEYGKGWDDL